MSIRNASAEIRKNIKIKKIIDLIKKSGVLAIYEGKDCQWLSDGHATYPVTDLPEICSVTLCAMYDITAKQADKLRIIDRIALPTICNYADTVENEKIVPENLFMMVMEAIHQT